MNPAQPGKRLGLIYSFIALAMLLILFVVWSTSRPPRILTREEAERDAYMHLQSYCARNNIDISHFSRPKIIRGTLAHYNLKKKMDVQGPTWDFYYVYRGKPNVVVFISYDEMNRSTELVHVFGPGEKWPW